MTDIPDIEHWYALSDEGKAKPMALRKAYSRAAIIEIAESMAREFPGAEIRILKQQAALMECGIFYTHGFDQMYDVKPAPVVPGPQPFRPAPGSAAAMADLLGAWFAEYRDKPVSAREVVERAARLQQHELASALRALDLLITSGGRGAPMVLTMHLKRAQGKVYGCYTIDCQGYRNNCKLWSVGTVEMSLAREGESADVF